MNEASHWHSLRALFESLLELPAEQRAAELERRALDPVLRLAVERMLAADALESHAAARAAAAPASAGASAARAAQLAPPRALGHYELRALLGAGGMGEVYLAHDSELDRRVALKLLSQRYTTDPRWLERFRREARAASSVNHPNVLTIHEIGEVDGTHFIATEYIEGETLRARLGQGALPPQEALEIAIQIASALGAAHAAGIVHRDVKPENVMLRRDGFVKVLDFGLAKAAPGSELEAEGAQLLTTPGLVVGTLAYMSPEQARGQRLDARSDVYSVGVVLYELLTGRVPFSGPSPIDAIVAILQHAPERLAPSIERALPGISAVLERALQKSREARQPDSQALCAELRALRSRSQIAPALAGAASGAQAAAQAALAAGVPPIRYAQSGEINIAYQVIGDAPVDLVFVMGWVSHLEYFWSEPSFARFLRRLAGFARVILFDKRGTGLSDRVPIDQLPSLEQRMDDVRAVMEAAGSERAVLCGVSEGGPLCTLFAATHPEKTIALVMIGSYARRLRDADYPWGPSAEQREAFLAEIRERWGGPVGIEARAPSRAQDPSFRDWWAAYLRHGASPSAAVALTRMNAEIDIRNVLPSVQVPTLVVHRSGDKCLVVEEGRYLAERIPGARFVELPGVDHLPFVGEQDEILDAVEHFLTGMRPAANFDRVLATVLIAQLDARAPATAAEPSASRFESFVSAAPAEVQSYHGQLTRRGADSVLATFDGPARAIRAACALSDRARRLGLALRIGLHTGECDLMGAALGGVAVEIAERVAARAQPGSVLVSSTVRNLVAGAGIRFAPRGSEELGGDVGALDLFAVERGVAS